jgi:hypothetical protein
MFYFTFAIFSRYLIARNVVALQVGEYILKKTYAQRKNKQTLFIGNTRQSGLS